MTIALIASSTWLHLLATVVVVGLYVLAYFAFTPAATQDIRQTAQIGVVKNRIKHLRERQRYHDEIDA